MKKREREREYDLLWADLDLPPANPSSPPFPLTLGRNDNVSSFFFNAVLQCGIALLIDRLMNTDLNATLTEINKEPTENDQEPGKVQ